MTPKTYAIKMTRYFYGPATKRSLVLDERGYPAQFDTRNEADEHVSYIDEGVYHQSHNESGRPEYAVVRVDRLPRYLAAQL